MTRPEEVIPYGFDGTAVLKQRPDALVFPRTVEQVAECVALASTSAVRIVVRGSGTGLSGGSVPLSGGLVLGLTRMDAVLAVDARNLTLRAQAGVTTERIDEAAADCESGLGYALAKSEHSHLRRLEPRGSCSRVRRCRAKEPVIFMKPTSAITGPNDGIVIPGGAKKVDWEVELGVVIGSHTKYVTETEALSHVAGCCVINDVSERAFQLEGTGQWVKGKGADTFGPIGLDGNRGRSTGSTGFASLARD